jgi:Family of unknown function (DUF5681)
MTAPQTTSASYEVGYGKPPRPTQFQKGQSGNPGGRPRRSPAARLDELALYEAYRTTVVMEDGHAVPMPAIQAVLRSQLQSAASGNVRAQRDILAMIRDIELVRHVLGSGSADDDVVDTDDADASVGGDNDLDDGAGAGRDDAGGADDDEPARQHADGVDTHGERRQAERGVLHPPLKGEGKVGFSAAEGSPGWGDGRATPPPYPPPQAGEGREGDFAEPLSPPPGPLTRADLPPAETPTLPSPAGGGGKGGGGSATQQNDRSRQQQTSVVGGEGAWEPAAPPLAVSAPQPENAAAPPDGRTPSLQSGSGSGQSRGVLPRRNGPRRSAGVQPARPQPARRLRDPAVNAGKIRGRRSGSARRSSRRTKAGPGPAKTTAGRLACRPPLRNETKN